MTTDQTNMWRTARRASLGLLAMLVLPACANDKGRLTKELDGLRADIVQLRASNLALEDRLDAVEGGELDEEAADEAHADGEDGDDADDSGPRRPRATPDGRPNLRVIRLSPSAATSPASVPASAELPATGEPAVVLELNGDAYPGESKSERWRRRAAAASNGARQ